MGKKGRKDFDDDEGFTKQPDTAIGFVSHKKTLAKEAKEAEKGIKTKQYKDQGSDSDEDRADKKQKK